MCDLRRWGKKCLLPRRVICALTRLQDNLFAVMKLLSSLSMEKYICPHFSNAESLTAFWPASSSDIFGDWLIFCRHACPGLPMPALPICCRLLSWQGDWQVRYVIQPVNLISSYTMFNVHRAPSCRETNARGTRPGGFFTPSSQVKISCTDLPVCAQSLSAPWVSVCRSKTRKPCRALDEL